MATALQLVEQALTKARGTPVEIYDTDRLEVEDFGDFVLKHENNGNHFYEVEQFLPFDDEPGHKNISVALFFAAGPSVQAVEDYMRSLGEPPEGWYFYAINEISATEMMQLIADTDGK